MSDPKWTNWVRRMVQATEEKGLLITDTWETGKWFVPVLTEQKEYWRKKKERMHQKRGRDKMHTMRIIVQKTVHRARSDSVLLRSVYFSIFTWIRTYCKRKSSHSHLSNLPQKVNFGSHYKQSWGRVGIHFCEDIYWASRSRTATPVSKQISEIYGCKANALTLLHNPGISSCPSCILQARNLWIWLWDIKWWTFPTLSRLIHLAF